MASKAALIAAVAVLLLAVPTVRGAGALPLLHWTFDRGPDGWRVVHGPGQVRITIVPEHVKIGAGALEGSYTLAPRTYFAVARDLIVRDHPAITLSFWIKSMKSVLLAMFLTERDASGYGYPLALPVGQWKKVVLTSRQFTLDAGSSDNTDENGRLDVGQIAWITIADFGGLFSHERVAASFYVDDFRIAP